jgi:hypothetical protein
MQKQQVKKSLLTPYRILIGLAIVCIFVMASYKVYTMASTKAIDQINEAHGKYIEQKDDSSSGQEGGSVSGSSSSKQTKNSEKPTTISKPAGKDTISSNTGGMGTGSNDDDDD